MSGDAANLEKNIEQLKKTELPTELEVRSLCDKAKEILTKENNVERVG